MIRIKSRSAKIYAQGETDKGPLDFLSIKGFAFIKLLFDANRTTGKYLVCFIPDPAVNCYTPSYAFSKLTLML